MTLYKASYLKKLLTEFAKSTYESNDKIYYQPSGSIIAQSLEDYLKNIEPHVLIPEDEFNDLLFRAFNSGQHFQKEEDSKKDFPWFMKKIRTELEE